MILPPQVESPIVSGATARLLRRVPAQTVVDAFEKDVHVDVSEYFSGLDSIGLYECDRTTYRFYYPHSLAGRPELYDQLFGRDTANYYVGEKWEFLEAVKHVRPGDRVLDVGCGSGAFLALAMANGAEVQGIETSEAGRRAAEARGFQVSREAVSVFAEANRGAFEVVTAFQVLEHVPLVQQFLQCLLSLLRPGGRLIVAVPNDGSFLIRFAANCLSLPPHHMGLWDSRSLGRLAPVLKARMLALVEEPLHSERLATYCYVASTTAGRGLGKIAEKALS